MGSPVSGASATGISPPGSEAGSGKVAVIARNAAANLVRHGSAWVLVIVLPPILIRYTSKEMYGIWILILQMAGYISLMDAAIQGAVGRYVAQAEEQKSRKNMSQMVSSALLLLVIAAIFGAIAIAGLAWELPRVLRQASPDLLIAARRALLIIGLSYAATLPFAAMAGTFLGLQRSGVLALATTVGKVVSAIGVVWAAMHHKGLAIMATMFAIGILLQAAVYLLKFRDLPQPPQFAKRFLNRDSTRSFLSFTIAILLTQLSSLLISGLDMPIVTGFDLPHAAFYAIAINVSNTLLISFGAVVNPLMPVAAGAHTRNDPRYLGDMLLRTTRYALCLLYVMSLFLILALRPLLTWWLNADYALHAMSVCQLLLVAQALRLSLLPYALIAFGAGQQRQMLLSPLGEGAVNLICSLVGAHYLGAVGVALGTVIGAVAGVLLHFLVSLKRTTAIEVDRYQLLVEAARPAGLTLLAAAAFAMCIHWQRTNLATFAFASAASLLAAWLLWRFSFKPDDRNYFIRHLRARFGRTLSPLDVAAP